MYMMKTEIYVSPEVRLHELSYEGNLCISGGFTEEVFIVEGEDW